MSSYAELADYEWLVGPEAAKWLRDIAGLDQPLHTITARLRRQLTASQAHLLLELAELRQRAVAKFDRAGEMFFTRLGLEQATDQWVAAYKALRFAEVSGPTADLCCGIGGDLIGLASAGFVTGIDRDPISACLATANARVHGLNDQLTLQIGEIERVDLSNYAAWHVDPDRRPTGKRTTSLDWSNPCREQIDKLLAKSPHAAMKLAPAADAPANWADRCELEWISRDRQCRQLIAWHGSLAKSPGQWRATVLSNAGILLRSLTGVANLPIPIAAKIDQYLFEPDPAVLAAHLGGVLAAEHGLSMVSTGVAYYTGPRPVADPALVCFDVEVVMPLEMRQLAGYLRKHDLGQLEIKKRGVDHDPSLIRKQLKLTGNHAATLFLTKFNGKHVAILARRMVPPQHLPSLSPVSNTFVT